MFIKQNKESCSVIDLDLCHRFYKAEANDTVYPFRIYFIFPNPDDGVHSYFRFKKEDERDSVFKNICQLISVVEIGN